MQKIPNGSIRWSWRNVCFSLVTALPATLLITSGNSAVGLVGAVGVLPAVIIGIPPSYRRLVQLPIIGIVFGAAMLGGSVLAQWPPLAIASIGLLCFGTSLLSLKRPQLASLIMALPLALVGVGFSYDQPSEIFGLSVVILAGSLWATLIAAGFVKWWPLAPPAQPAPPRPMTKRQAVVYGICYGAAAMIAAIIGFVNQLDHVGWVVGAVLFVMRPQWEVEHLRAYGRALSVTAGALAAAALLALTPGLGITAALVSVALALAGATKGSRWYITPAFTTFIVFFVILYASPTTASIEHRFVERTLETLVGVAIAVTAGLAARTFSKPRASNLKTS